MKLSQPQPRLLVQKSKYNKLPKGNKLFETMKSSKSWIVVPVPKGAKSLQRLKPRTQGIDKMIIKNKLTTTAFLRSQPHKSMAKLMMFSKTAIIVERAAKLIKTKKSAPQICPAGIWLKILGKVTKTRPGP